MFVFMHSSCVCKDDNEGGTEADARQNAATNQAGRSEWSKKSE